MPQPENVGMARPENIPSLYDNDTFTANDEQFVATLLGQLGQYRDRTTCYKTDVIHTILYIVHVVLLILTRTWVRDKFVV